MAIEEDPNAIVNVMVNRVLLIPIDPNAESICELLIKIADLGLNIRIVLILDNAIAILNHLRNFQY